MQDGRLFPPHAVFPPLSAPRAHCVAHLHLFCCTEGGAYPTWGKTSTSDSRLCCYLFIKNNTWKWDVANEKIFEEGWAHWGLWWELNFPIQWTKATFHYDIVKDKHHCISQLPAVSFWRTLSGWQRKPESQGKNQTLQHGIIWSWSSGMPTPFLLLSGGLFLINHIIMPHCHSPGSPNADQQCPALLLSVEQLQGVYLYFITRKAHKIKLDHQFAEENVIYPLLH